jgi:hypothetical protein
MWRNTIRGHEEAIKELREFSTKTANEVCLIHLPTQTLLNGQFRVSGISVLRSLRNYPLRTTGHLSGDAT